MSWTLHENETTTFRLRSIVEYDGGNGRCVGDVLGYGAIDLNNGYHWFVVTYEVDENRHIVGERVGACGKGKTFDDARIQANAAIDEIGAANGWNMKSRTAKDA